MSRRYPLLVHLLTVLVISFTLPAGVRGDEKPPANAPGVLPPAELVGRWLKAPPARRAPLEEALRKRGTSVLTHLDAAARKADESGKDRLRCLADRVRSDWYRKQTPNGMVYIPAGTVEVPRARWPWGPAGRRVKVSGFYIDRTEVTVAVWRKWIAHLLEKPETEIDARGLWLPPDKVGGTLPAVRVSWTEAVRFALEFRGGRLPKAEEFERALRGSGIARYPWGDAMREGYANLRGFGPGERLPVGRHPKGASVFGVQDLVGNVAEWSATIIRQGSRGRFPAVLGGSYRDEAGPALTWRGLDRMAARLSQHEDRNWVGFRVAKDLPSLH